MQPGTYAQRVNVPTRRDNGEVVNIPIDMVVMPKLAASGDLPLLIEAKSAIEVDSVSQKSDTKSRESISHALR
jgi:hypothetical protein